MTPCLFSISYAGFWGQHTLPLEDFIGHAGDLGYPSVMIAGKRPHLSPLDASEEKIATYEMCSPLRGGGSLEKLDACAQGYLGWMASQGFAEG